MVKKILCFAVFLLLLLALSACASDEDTLIKTLNDREYTFEFYGKGENISSVTVKKDGKPTNVFKLDGKDPVLEDLNFDGYKDVKLCDNKAEGHYICYVYQSEVGVFSFNAILGDMLDPVWDSESKTVKSRIYDKVKTTHDEVDAPAAYKETRGEALWEWQGGVLVKLSETGLEYFSDSGLFCYYRCTLTGGECVRDNSADKWYYYDELEKHGLSWEK